MTQGAIPASGPGPPNVAFPSGMVVEGYDAERSTLPSSPVNVHYGAAGTAVASAVTPIAELLESDIPQVKS